MDRSKEDRQMDENKGWTDGRKEKNGRRKDTWMDSWTNQFTKSVGLL